MNKFWNNRNNSAAFRYWISIYCQVGILGDLRAGDENPARNHIFGTDIHRLHHR